MTAYYVRKTGSDANSGLSPALAKLTITAAHTACSAGDTLHVGAGVYRETLTITKANVSVLGDYLGTNTGDAGVVRMSGSNDDSASTRDRCISVGATGVTIRWMALGSATYPIIIAGTASNLTVSDCVLGPGGYGIQNSNFLSSGTVVERCYFKCSYANGIWFYEPGFTDKNMGWTIRDCIFGGPTGIRVDNAGGMAIERCRFLGVGTSVSFNGGTLPTVPITLRYSLSDANSWWLSSGVLGAIVENNNVFNVAAGYGRLNVAAGAASLTRHLVDDMRPFFDHALLGQAPTTWDIDPSWLIANNAVGAGAYATDMRGTGLLGANREVGPLELDVDLFTGAGGGGGAVSISPLTGVGG